jgi:glycosyltransferase involved in cell wall biosynthesis
MKKNLQNGFGVYFDPTRTTSGQRFFGELCQALSKEAIPFDQRPAVVLFNISAPWRLILRAKLNRQKVALRVDGLYCDRLSPAFLASFMWPLRTIFSLGLKFAWAHDFLATLANLLNQNYGGFFRILFADLVIYQSKFSHKVHNRYFSRKPFSIIVNGSTWRVPNEMIGVRGDAKPIRLITIYDDWKPAKRMSEIVRFVQWLNETKKTPIHLTIIGYTGKIPAGAPTEMKAIIETSPFIKALPQFKVFSSELTNVLLGGDLYLSFSYRDPCPNVVVEAMAHGLPVVGIGSGGLPDIAGAAGVLLPADDFEQGFFASHRYEHEFPPIDFDKVLEAIKTVVENHDYYRRQVRERFENKLDIQIVAKQYASVLRQVKD